MATIWFVLVAFMLTAYVVLDGFDLGAGVLHLGIARTDAERRLVLRSIGPVWDGNEVWLLAAGGTLYYAFPVLYASSLSGFYLSINMVLWLLMLRAVGIEFRAHLESKVWWDFFDGAFCLSSALLSLFFGVALGNVIRGVPLRPDGSFFEPLWTDFGVGTENGILDWFTLCCGLLALIALTVHGAAWVALKTEGPVQERARRAATLLFAPLLVLAAFTLFAALWLRPQLLDNYRQHWLWGAIIPIAVAASLLALVVNLRRGRDRAAFLASCVFLIAMLSGVAFALHPRLLPASTLDAYSLTIHNAASGAYSLKYGVYWWSAGMAIAVGYFVFIYWMFRGKARLGPGGHGY
ncbi:MAG TPA: cytochrome d ubiquinol oxidase subunit II [Myxococcales bacterium]|nr:cytochrome d ubiquinol oxidase subunit II [Myxococcales bacterium]